jgi:hypothetical protein
MSWQRRPYYPPGTEERAVELYRTMSIEQVRKHMAATMESAPSFEWIRRAVTRAGVIRTRSAGVVLAIGKRKRSTVTRFAAALAAGESIAAAARLVGVSWDTGSKWAALLRRQEEREEAA